MYSDKLSKFVILITVLFIASVIFSGCGGIVPSLNHPPAISYLTANSDTIEAGHNTIITCYATDQDGDQLTYTWTKTEGTVSGSGSIVAWTAPATAGTYTITCSVSDGKGGEDSKSVSIQVLVLNQTPKPMVSGVEANAVTYHLSTMSKAPNRIIQKLEGEISKELIPDIKFTNTEERRRGEIDYGIELYWDNYIGASGYKIYRSVNGENYAVIFNGTDCCCSCYYYFFDNNIEEGNIYFYYITAYGGNWETIPSEVFIIDTWLPSCSLISPLNNEVINNSNLTFSWSPVGLSNFPYGSIYSGYSDLWVYDDTAEQTVWQRIFHNNMTISTITYNDDGYATPLVSGHTYVWTSWGLGYDENNNLIAISVSDYWVFTYIRE
ncbi:MAG: Ig-like domain-containing protein [bacterium]